MQRGWSRSTGTGAGEVLVLEALLGGRGGETSKGGRGRRSWMVGPEVGRPWPGRLG